MKRQVTIAVKESLMNYPDTQAATHNTCHSEQRPEDINKEFHPRCMSAVPCDIDALLAELDD